MKYLLMLTMVSISMVSFAQTAKTSVKKFEKKEVTIQDKELKRAPVANKMKARKVAAKKQSVKSKKALAKKNFTKKPVNASLKKYNRTVKVAKPSLVKGKVKNDQDLQQPSILVPQNKGTITAKEKGEFIPRAESGNSEQVQRKVIAKKL